MKEKTTTFSVGLVQLDKVKYPLVKATFMGKDGKPMTGLLLVDSGSSSCILDKAAVSLIAPATTVQKEQRITGLGGDMMKYQGASYTFSMGGKKFQEVFFTHDNASLCAKFGGAVWGLIGLRFLARHGLVLDYNTQTLHKSEGKLEKDPKDYSFFFPMSFGLERYELPVIGMISDDTEYVLIADSGANQTVFTKYVLEESGLHVPEKSNDIVLSGVTSKSMNATTHELEYDLLSLGGTSENPKLVHCKDEVIALGNCLHLMEGLKDREGNALLPISGLLSSGFMLANRWVMDFGMQVMYSDNT